MNDNVRFADAGGDSAQAESETEVGYGTFDNAIAIVCRANKHEVYTIVHLLDAEILLSLKMVDIAVVDPCRADDLYIVAQLLEVVRLLYGAQVGTVLLYGSGILIDQPYRCFAFCHWVGIIGVGIDSMFYSNLFTALITAEISSSLITGLMGRLNSSL